MAEQMSVPFSSSTQAAALPDHQVAHALVPLPAGSPIIASSPVVAPAAVAKAIEEVPVVAKGVNPLAIAFFPILAPPNIWSACKRSRTVPPLTQ